MVQERGANRAQLRPHLKHGKNAGTHVPVALAFGLVRLAVAAGFEPAEGCPSRAFEARSLGRSDTPPRGRLPKERARTRIRFTRAPGRSVLHGPCETVAYLGRFRAGSDQIPRGV